jgi:hypothetical protein
VGEIEIGKGGLLMFLSLWINVSGVFFYKELNRASSICKNVCQQNIISKLFLVTFFSPSSLQRIG